MNMTANLVLPAVIEARTENRSLSVPPRGEIWTDSAPLRAHVNKFPGSTPHSPSSALTTRLSDTPWRRRLIFLIQSVSALAFILLYSISSWLIAGLSSSSSDPNSSWLVMVLGLVKESYPGRQQRLEPTPSARPWSMKMLIGNLRNILPLGDRYQLSPNRRFLA
jgi:hypothetical protein